jgi:archaellum component FlaF (FlaF/FlaG flagellin family)
MIYIKVRVASGSSNGLFNIYYDDVDQNKIATLYSNGSPAIGLSSDDLSNLDGIIVSVPDASTSVIVLGEPNSFCSEDNISNDRYVIPVGCYTYTVTSNYGKLNYQYIDCDCNEITSTIDATYGTVQNTFCALYGTVIAGNMTVAVLGNCSPIQTPTPTPTPTSTPTTGFIIYRSGVSSRCDDFCENSYNFITQAVSTSPYSLIGSGDVIDGITMSGFYAISPTGNTDDPFKVVETDSSGEVITVSVCSGGSCIIQ